VVAPAYDHSGTAATQRTITTTTVIIIIIIIINMNVICLDFLQPSLLPLLIHHSAHS